ncbi:UNKNOWN [Stylonychia lemnae]|uniref:Glutamine amidotransferase domain-containing protein n=1 Tax=Stylonychia lemnae TaxID=5949 RepID=A0A078AWW8_STYLE|nr:UNKNOWN [Stylonychia lemnae]|eukprot:CDW86551.1 UNKNOWN [Stylonychia lemnae]
MISFAQINKPSFLKSFVYPFSIDYETNQHQILMLFNKATDSFEDFGDEFNDLVDGNIFQTLSRSLMAKSFNLLVPSIFKKRMSEKLISDTVHTFKEQTVDQIMDSSYIREVYGMITSHETIKILGNEILTVAFKIPQIDLNLINKAIKENLQNQQIYEFIWLTLDQIHFQTDDIIHHLSGIHVENLLKISDQLKIGSEFNIQETFEQTEKNQEKIEKAEQPAEYAIILYDEREHYQNVYESLFMGNFISNNNEKWTFYKAYDLEFPDEKTLKNLKGIILPGSKYSVYDESLTWIEPLKDFVRKVYYDYQNIKLVGICFGHQLIAHSLGGKTEKMKQDVSNCMYIGKEEIKLQNTFFELPFVQKVLENVDISNIRINPLILNAVHQDHVITLPQDAICHGSSERTNVEIYTMGDRVYSYQAHPEFSYYHMKEFVINKLFTWGRLSESEKETLQTEISDDRLLMRQFILKTIKTFIKSEY